MSVIFFERKEIIYYKYRLAAKTMSLFNNLIASENLFSNSTLPMFFEAWTICLNNSSSNLMDLNISKHQYHQIALINIL